MRLNKRAISEVISYVLLITIAISMAAGVYAWLKFYVPSDQEKEKCQDDTALSIIDYECSIESQILRIVVENNGLFNTDGFIIRASNNYANIPTAMLVTINDPLIHGSTGGIYNFGTSLKLGEISDGNFSYEPISNVERIQVQPFVNGKKDILICPSVIDIKISGCNSPSG